MYLKKNKGILLLILGGIFIGIIICEIVLQIIIKIEILPESNHFFAYVKQIDSTRLGSSIYRYSKDITLRLEFIPNSRRNHIRINSYGFRGRDYNYIPLEGTTRIAFLGDSETFGALLNEDETLPGCLENVLNNKNSKRNYEVLNFGFPGYNTLQEFRLLKTKVIKFNPSIVILYYVFNDPFLGSSFVTLKKRKLIYNSYFYLLIKWYYEIYFPRGNHYMNIHNNKKLIQIYRDLHNSEYFNICKMLIKEMSYFLHEKRIRFILVIAPEVLTYNDFNQYPYKDIHEKLTRFSSEQLEVIDPLHVLAESGYKPTDFWVTLTDCHKNKKANMIIAEEISNHIVKENCEKIGY